MRRGSHSKDWKWKDLVGGTLIGALSIGPVTSAEADELDDLMAEPTRSTAPKTPTRPKKAAETVVEVMIVRGTKKTEAERSQDIPVAVSAFSADQLAARQVQNLESLTFAAPNVTLDSIGTAPGVANFEIRGLGINSSIPSIDPTVGVFVDGMYLGVNYGVVFDTFDLESVEILRGPQGLLFGRNVTGGAVLLRTKRPGDELSVDARASVESGIEYSLAAGVEAPLIEGLLNARFSGQWRDDDGYFKNDFNGKSNLGEARTYVLRPVFTLTPAEDIDVTVIVEHGDLEGDGTPAQNRGRFSDFDISIDEEGRVDADWTHVIAELNWFVPFGDGKITNVFGWREVQQSGRGDIDATPSFIFHADLLLDQDQFSNELRYSGRFADMWDVTAGAYFFTQDILYRERRELLGGAIDSTFGGNQEHLTFGFFTQSDLDLTHDLTLTAGLRYTYEEKKVAIATFGVPSPCGVNSRDCTFDFRDEDNWKNLTPKVGLQWFATEAAQVYGHWSRGFRSGGYNFRNTSPTAAPGPFDEEKQDSFEIGAKTEWAGGMLRANVAAFYNQIDDMQREVNLPDPTTGVVQIIRNTADATITGVELDAVALVTGNFALTAAVGYNHGKYDSVKFDLNGDGVVDGRDKDLDLPRLSNWSASIGATYDHELGDLGFVTLRPNYAFRDDAAYTDNNRGTLPEGHVIDASLAFSPYGMTAGDKELQLTFSVYGKNLLHEAFRGGDTILPPSIGPAPLGGTFSPLKEGRVIGFETRVKF